jgi:cellulose synthase/poly-beta-1,6-N-acetylglucosamine synthase-like glycosyltransferase
VAHGNRSASIYNERCVVERLLDAVRGWTTRANCSIAKLDDSTDETREVALACVSSGRRGLPIRYMHRGHRTGFKAGNLAEPKSAAGEFVAHFDADFVPAGFPASYRALLLRIEDPTCCLGHAGRF